MTDPTRIKKWTLSIELSDETTESYEIPEKWISPDLYHLLIELRKRHEEQNLIIEMTEIEKL